MWVKEPRLRHALAPKYHGPYEVVQVEYPVITIRREGCLVRVNVDRVKPAFRLQDVEENQVEVPEEQPMVLYYQRAQDAYNLPIVEVNVQLN